jgi:hypothetical protein
MSTPTTATRTRLMQQHVEARRRRDAAPLGSDEYRAACEDIARIEIEIAASEEPSQAAAPLAPAAPSAPA